MYEVVEQARNNGGDPMAMLKQITGGYTPEQMGQLMTQARNFGIPDDVLNQLQNDKTTEE